MVLDSLTLIFGLALLAFLIALSWTDIKSYRLPDKLTFPLMWLGVLEGYFSGSIKTRLLGLIIGYIVFLAIEYGFKALRGKDGLGRGDAKLLAAGGAWCGWMGLPFIVLIASGCGLAAALLPSIRTSAQDDRIPFGPFLAFAIFMVWAANAYVQAT